MVDTPRAARRSPPSTRSWRRAGRLWSPPGRWMTGLLADRDRARPRRAAPRPVDYGDDAAAVRGRRLRRLLRLRAPRLQRRPDVPARPRAAAAQLEAPPGGLPRPLRHRRRRPAPTSYARAGSARRRRTSAPTYGPSPRLDIEAELGFVVGMPSRLGERVSTADFARHTFGVVGLNDWSARDIQAWEYVPLGPFLGKSFATSISAWVTPLAALDAAWTDLPGQDARRCSTTSASTGPPASTSRWRWCSTARSSPGRRTARCTGRRRRCWPTPPSTAPALRTGDLWASRHDLGPRAGPARLAARAELGRQGAVHRRRARAHVPRGRRRGDAALLRARHRRAAASRSARSPVGSCPRADVLAGLPARPSGS